MRWRIALGLFVLAAVIGSLGVVLARQGLDNADRIASVGSLFVGLVGLLQLVEPVTRLFTRAPREVPSLAAAAAGAAPPVNPHFTGRAAELAELARVLDRDGRAGIEGIGGVGKTELAAKYVETAKDRYRRIWWIRGHNDEVAYADATGIVETLRTERDWLLVIDDVGTETTIGPFLSAALSGHVIVTSRQHIDPIGASIVLTDWAEPDAVAFLRRTLPAGEQDLDRLAASLFRVPLALSQAANFIRTSGISVAEFLRLFDAQKRRVLDTGTAFNRTDTVATMLRISLRAAEKEAPGCTELLRMCSLYAVGAIPADLPPALGHMRFRLAEFGIPIPVAVRFRRGLRDPLTYARWTAALAGQRLIAVGGGNIVVHPLIAEIVKTGLSRKKRCELVYFGAIALHALLEEKGPELWRAHLPHAVAIGTLARDLDIPFLVNPVSIRASAARREASLLLSEGSRKMYGDGGDEGRRLARMSLELAEMYLRASARIVALPPPHTWPVMARALLANAAYAMRDKDYATAKALFLRASTVTSRDDPRTLAVTLRGMVSAELRLGNRAEAAALLDKRLPALSRRLPSDDPLLTRLRALRAKASTD